MKPPSSDAEALRDQKATQVRPAYGLLMAANELRHLKRRQQIRTRGFGRWLLWPAAIARFCSQRKDVSCFIGQV
jgi:hypothetical protein